jgi:hypothetical protein
MCIIKVETDQSIHFRTKHLITEPDEKPISLPKYHLDPDLSGLDPFQLFLPA